MISPATLTPDQEYNQLQAQFAVARQTLAETEAELAQYQAQINAFRMHCRLKLDDLVETIIQLQAEKQALLTHLQLQNEESTPPPNPELPPLPYDRLAEKRLYRELARRFHPDLAGDNMEVAYRTSLMALVNRAYAAHDIQTLYDLAGELDPNEMAQLTIVAAGRLRKLRDQIMRCQRRQRKAQQQLKALLQEKTARIWQRAQRLNSQGDNWWDEVRLDLYKAIAQLTAEIEKLRNPI